MGLAREILAGLGERLHEHAGLDLPEWVIESRAMARMSALDLGAEAYLDLVSTDEGAAELRALVEAVRVGETRFFRHRPHVDALLDVVVPAWRAQGERSPRVWSAGCATGEEPYTLALVLARALPRPAFTPTILATDVSAEALGRARAGVYPASAAGDVPEPWRDGLVSHGDGVRVRPEIAALVRFKQHNLADAELPRGFDLVWCRNVLIYFGPEARKRVLERLVAALEPGGFLFVGTSETLRDAPGLRAIRYADQVLWQKPETTGPASAAVSAQAAAAARGSAHPVAAGKPAAVQQGRGSSPGAPGGPIVFKSYSTRAPAPSRPPEPQAARATLRLTSADPASVAAEIRTALAAPGLSMLTIDLDAAGYLDDAVAPVLKRAGAAAEAAGIDLVLRATRPGPQRWLRRNGLAGVSP